MKHAVVLFCLHALLLSGCEDAGDGKLEASGIIEGIDVRISSLVAGRVQSLRVDEGSVVAAGDTLLQIDAQDYRLQLRQAAASAEAAEAQYRLALEGARKEDIIQAEAALDAAETDFERAQTLIETETITKKQFDDARTRYVTAQQTYDKLVSGLRENEILTARAHRDQAAALVSQLRKRVADCSVEAPAKGVVTVKSVEPGEFVPVGGGLFRLTVLDTVKLTIYVNQLQLARIRVGQDAAVSIDGAPGREFQGSIVSISDVAEFTPKNVQTKEERTKLVFAVRIRIPNPDQVLKPGMPADAVLHLRDVSS